MNLIGIESLQIFGIFLVPDMLFGFDETGIFFLEYLLKDTLYRIAVVVIAAVFGDFVDKEKGKALDSFLEKLTLLFEVGLNRLSDLNTLHVKFVGIANDITLAQSYAIGKSNVCDRLRVRAGKDFDNIIQGEEISQQTVWDNIIGTYAAVISKNN